MAELIVAATPLAGCICMPSANWFWTTQPSIRKLVIVALRISKLKPLFSTDPVETVLLMLHVECRCRCRPRRYREGRANRRVADRDRSIDGCASREVAYFDAAISRGTGAIRNVGVVEREPGDRLGVDAIVARRSGGTYVSATLAVLMSGSADCRP